jgi:hypothetical protein
MAALSLAVLLLCLRLAPCAAQQPQPGGAGAIGGGDLSFDEKLKLVGLEFAARVVQPDASRQRLQDLVDALNGGEAGAHVSRTGGASRVALADVAAAAARPGAARVRWAPLPPASSSAAAGVFFVDAVRGADGNAGSEDSPFRTIARGVAAARGGGTVVLRAGTFYQGAAGLGAVALSPADSGLTLMAYPGEEVWVSGAAQLPNLTWAPFRVNASTGENVWVASTAAAGVAPFSGLRWAGARLVRARFPNTLNPELGMGEMFLPRDEDWFDPAWCKGGVCKNPPARFEPASPSRANESRSGTLFTLGIGGDGCSLFSPPAGFNCVDNQRWGGMVLRWPAGFHASASDMPHTPYASAIADPRNPAQINGWQGWFSRHFLVAGYDPASNNITFGKGGFQGAEGMDDGFPMSIENVFEELDSPAEWFHDVVAQKLYLWHNATAGTPPPSDGSLAATQAQVLFNATGTQAAPVVGVSFRGLGFRDTAHTLFEPHGHPSSGDWALQRTAALFFEGTEGVTVEGCVFERFDGLGVFLSGYARNASIKENEFAWGGETSVALWGYTRGSPVPGMGPDTTGGDQPRGTYIGYNVFREIGVWQKQSAAVFQAECGLSTIEHNFIYNGPRAGICFNDGSMGGSVIQFNVMANLCRESGDHGPFNSVCLLLPPESEACLLRAATAKRTLP